MIHKNPVAKPHFIKLDTVAHKVGMGKSTILAWESTNRFPRAVRLSKTLRVWLESDIEQWILEQHSKAHGNDTRDKDASSPREVVSRVRSK